MTIVAGDFNAKLHGPINEDEETVMGKQLWGRGTEHVNQMSEEARTNRDLLIETAMHENLVIKNTYFQKPPKRQVTKTNLGHNQNDTPTHASHEILDHWLIDARWKNSIVDINTYP